MEEEWGSVDYLEDNMTFRGIEVNTDLVATVFENVEERRAFVLRKKDDCQIL